MRKLLLITIILSIFTIFPAAEDDFRIYNPDTVTSDLDATFIQGDITANGQTITVTSPDGVIAEKIVPNTGGKYVFRIKIPRDSIKTEGITSYAVTAKTADGKKTTYARIRYKAKKKQNIKIDKTEYKLHFPGNASKVKALL